MLIKHGHFIIHSWEKAEFRHCFSGETALWYPVSCSSFPQSPYVSCLCSNSFSTLKINQPREVKEEIPTVLIHFKSSLDHHLPNSGMEHCTAQNLMLTAFCFPGNNLSLVSLNPYENPGSAPHGSHARFSLPLICSRTGRSDEEPHQEIYDLFSGSGSDTCRE